MDTLANVAKHALWYRIITTLLLYGLFMEWMLPWFYAADWLNMLQPKLVAVTVAIALFIGLFKPSLWQQTILYTVIIVSSLYVTYGMGDTTFLNWIIVLPEQYIESIKQIFQFGMLHMTDLLRTTLLLFGWLLLIPSLQMLVWQYHIAAIVFLPTAAYLLLLHLFTGADLLNAMLRACLYGLLLMALTSRDKRMLMFNMKVKPELEKKYELSSKTINYWASILTFLFICIAGAGAMSMNKEKAHEPVSWSSMLSERLISDMAALSTQISGQPLNGTAVKSLKSSLSGYGDDDTYLGETIKLSDKPVFRAWTSGGQYWRGEAKTEYTGKGWLDNSSNLTLHTIKADQEKALMAWSNRAGLVGERIEQDVEWLIEAKQIPVFHNGIEAIIISLEGANPQRELLNYIINEETDSIYAPTASSVVSKYKVISELPITDEQLLRDIEPLDNELAEKVWLNESLEQYLQLPSTLPDRVKALASEVAGGGLTSRYDQVKAVEQFLKNNYTYSLKSSAPGENEDFVDHFLFEQHEGYCVHFSTAMVILLRAQDIPARWVKGYTMGTPIDTRTTDEGVVQTLYEVNERDAHAWVEVYFPGAGWVSFDPTPEHELPLGASGMLSRAKHALDAWSNQGRKWLGEAYDGVKLTASLIGISLVLAGAIITIGNVVIRSRWYRLYRYRRSYAKGMELLQRLEQSQLQLLPLKARKESLPLRIKHLRLEHDIHKLQDKLCVMVKQFVEQELSILEQKLDLKDVGALTLRSRVERMGSYCGSNGYELLLKACAWIEQMQYGDNQNITLSSILPEPNQLERLSRHVRVDLSLPK